MSEKVPVKDGIFTDGPDGASLLASRCKSCGQVYFPKVQSCLNCLHEELEEVLLSRKGKLFSYTVVHMATAHFDPPFAIGYVDLPEGVRIFAPLDIIEDKPFKVGMYMEMAIGSLWQEDDKEVVGYSFSPV